MIGGILALVFLCLIICYLAGLSAGGFFVSLIISICLIVRIIVMMCKTIKEEDDKGDSNDVATRLGMVVMILACLFCIGAIIFSFISGAKIGAFQ